MSRRGDERPTAVYIRCDACGKIVRPDPTRDLPEGWVDVGAKSGSNARRAACSPECAAKLGGA